MSTSIKDQFINSFIEKQKADLVYYDFNNRINKHVQNILKEKYKEPILYNKIGYQLYGVFADVDIDENSFEISDIDIDLYYVCCDEIKHQRTHSRLSEIRQLIYDKKSRYGIQIPECKFKKELWFKRSWTLKGVIKTNAVLEGKVNLSLRGATGDIESLINDYRYKDKFINNKK